MDCRAPINIAVIKYWGKRDERLILPVNSSLSLTLHADALCSHIRAHITDQGNHMTLNGQEVDMDANPRIQSVLNKCIEFKRRQLESDSQADAYEPFTELKFDLECSNNFPTAAGLASSASGYACMTKAITALYDIKETDAENISSIARVGSGSACRSMLGGFVKWLKGEREDGLDSVAEQIADESHWPEMRVLIVVTNESQKDVSSTSGMNTSTSTSKFLHYRTEHVVDERMKQMEDIIRRRDFEAFANLTMKDSNQFHAVCLDTFPPIFYLNETSRRVISWVHQLNSAAGRVVAAYSFDAGPNAFIFTLDSDVNEVALGLATKFCPPSFPLSEFVHDPMGLCPPELFSSIADDRQVLEPAAVRLLLTKVGPGAEILSDHRLSLS